MATADNIHQDMSQSSIQHAPSQINTQIWEERNILLSQKPGKHFEHVQKSIRFDTYIFKGKNSKNKMKEYMLSNPENKIAVQICDCKNYHQFITFINWETCWSKYLHTAWNKRYLYELILSDKPCKPYLDIEWLKISDDINEYDFILKLIYDIIQIFHSRYNLIITENNFFITEAHNDKKISFHLVITSSFKSNDVISNQFLFKTNKKKENNSAWDLYIALVELDNNYKNKIDGCVYSNDREFRTIYSTKFNQNRMFIPITISDIKNKKNSYQVRKTSDFIPNYFDYLITHLYDNIPIEFINTPPLIHPLLTPHNKYIVITDKEYNTKKISVKNNYNQKEPESEIIERLIELAITVHPTASYTGRAGDGFRFSYSDRNEPCYTGKTHKSNGFALYIKPNTGFVYMFCFSARCGFLLKVGHLYDNTTWHIGAISVDVPFIEYINPNEIYLEKKDLTVTHFIHSFIKKKGVACIKSPMGTGKTRTLAALIRGFFKNKRIMYISYRQTLSLNIEGVFPEFYNYMSGVHDLYLHDKVIIQVDSLAKLSFNLEFVFYDLIIMDEIESLLFHMSSKTMKDRMIICDILNEFIKGAQWIIALDADFAQRSYDFLNGIKSTPRVIINNFKPKQKRIFFFSSNYEKRLFQIIEDLKNGKNIVVVTLALNIADEIFENIKQFNVELYSSFSDDSSKLKLIDVNSNWTQKQCIIYTPTIDAGVDFNVKGYFDTMYCFVCKKSSTPRGFLQATGRIRHLKNNNIRACLHSTVLGFGRKILPTLIEEEDFIVNQYKNVTKKEIKLIGDNKFKLVSQKNHFTKLFAHNLLESDYANSIYLSILKELIVSKGFDYVNEDKLEDNDSDNDADDSSTDDNISTSTNSKTNDIIIEVENDATTTTISTEKNIYHIISIINAEDITYERFLELEDKKKKNLATRLNKFDLQKYYIKEKFKIDTFVCDDDKQQQYLIEFLLAWHNKENILDHALYALGKKHYDDSHDPYFSNIGTKIKYLNTILDVFGFKSLLDQDTVVESNKALDDKMENSKLMNKSYYSIMMKTFNKQDQAKDMNGKFKKDKFTKKCNSILNEFGFKVESNRKKINSRWSYKYILVEHMINIISIISKY